MRYQPDTFDVENEGWSLHLFYAQSVVNVMSKVPQPGLLDPSAAVGRIACRQWRRSCSAATFAVTQRKACQKRITCARIGKKKKKSRRSW